MLIVDDSAAVRRIVGMMLVGEGFSVDTAADGIVAQDMLGKNEYDIVLVDLRMPVMSGIELYRRIEGCPNVATKVVFMSADIPDPQTRSFFTKINRPFLLKPFTMDDFMNAFRSCNQGVVSPDGSETMLKYGIWQDWDEAQRAIATEEYQQKKIARAPEGEAATLCHKSGGTGIITL